MNVHRALPGFRGESSLSTLLYRISANTAINHLKKRDRHRQVVNVLANLRIIETEEPTAVETSLLEEPLKKLNPRQRMVLVLADAEEKKLEDISAIMKMPLGTVKSTLSRAREIVKKELMKHDRI